jgi:hypothetical protein
MASQRIEVLAQQQRATTRTHDTDSESDVVSRTPIVEEPDASTKPKHAQTSSKSKSKPKTKSLAAAVKELEQSLSSTTSSDSESSATELPPPAVDVTICSTASQPKSSKKFAVKKTAQTGPVMVARKEMAESSASASKPRPDEDLEDATWGSLPSYVAVYSRKREKGSGAPLQLDIRSTMAHCM